MARVDWTRKQVREMGLVCAQLGLSTPEEVQRYLVLGVRFEARAMLLPELIRDLQFVRSGAL